MPTTIIAMMVGFFFGGGGDVMTREGRDKPFPPHAGQRLFIFGLKECDCLSCSISYDRAELHIVYSSENKKSVETNRLITE